MKITNIAPQTRQNTQNRKTQNAQSFGTVRFTNVTTGKDVAQLESLVSYLNAPTLVKNIPHIHLYTMPLAKKAAR